MSGKMERIKFRTRGASRFDRFVDAAKARV
jgi:hypothetical protein